MLMFSAFCNLSKKFKNFKNIPSKLRERIFELDEKNFELVFCLQTNIRNFLFLLKIINYCVITRHSTHIL